MTKDQPEERLSWKEIREERAAKRAAHRLTMGGDAWSRRRRGHSVIDKSSGARLVRTSRGRLVLVVTPEPSDTARKAL
jgi:hypothetical protein